MADLLVWLVAALGSVGGVVLGRLWGRVEGKRAGKREAERDAMEDKSKRIERGRDAVRDGRVTGDPAERLRRNAGDGSQQTLVMIPIPASLHGRHDGQRISHIANASRRGSAGSGTPDMLVGPPSGGVYTATAGRILGVHVYAHQVAFAMTGAWPESQIDHINGQRSDNRWRTCVRSIRRRTPGTPQCPPATALASLA
jgi:hypothetical protein